MPASSAKLFPAIMRRLYRVIAFAYYHYRPQYDAFEVCSGLHSMPAIGACKPDPYSRARRHGPATRAMQEKYHWHQRFEKFCERYRLPLDPIIQPTS